MTEVEEALRNLMCRINRDGGHALTGDDVADANRCEGKVCDMLSEIDRLRSEINDGDYWMERSKLFQENGGCPVCFAKDEAGHTDDCEWGKAEAEVERLRGLCGEAERVIRSASDPCGCGFDCLKTANNPVYKYCRPDCIVRELREAAQGEGEK
jgi:hypothetical protein